MQLSVIVPVYNGEKYLRECIDSILSQTFQDYELILVNDGSIDRSGEICTQYAKANKKVVVYQKENEGVTCARLTGLKNAKGKYIAFVDADDWVEKDFFENLMESMLQNQADLVVTGCVKELGDKNEILLNNISDGIYSDNRLIQEFFPYMLHYQGFYQFGVLQYLWNKLYKKEILLRYFRNMDTNIYDGEDVAIIFPYMLSASRIVISSATKYHYRIHKDSVTANKKENYYQNCCYLYLYLYKEFKKTEYFKYMQPQLDQYMRKMIWQVSPQSFGETGRYVFPFNKIPKKSKIVLYGAGNVGKAYYYQVKKIAYCNIVLWVDKAYKKLDLQKLGVTEPRLLQVTEYDFLVIAIADQEVIKTVINTVEEIGVLKEKIIY